MTQQTPRYAGWKAQISLTALSLLALAGCSGSDGNGNGDLRTGTLFNAGIENIHYETRSQSGTTNEDGEFHYLPGETLTFRVGNLVLAEEVPAAPVLTPIDFTAEARQKLHNGGTGAEGLETHRTIETTLAENNRIAINVTRLLTVLAEQENPDADETLTINQRTIDQINDYLADNNGPPIDFSAALAAFAKPDTIGNQTRKDNGDLPEDLTSPANLMLDSICFAPEGDELCEAPPTNTEIEEATGERQEELDDERDEILNARKTLEDASADEATSFLKATTLDFKSNLESPFHLDPETLTIGPSDGQLRKVAIKRTGSSDFSLKSLDARAAGTGWAIHSINRQEGTVEFYRNTSRPTESGTIIVNFKVDYPAFDNYRWFRKNLLVEVN
ncbi:hypothetical protein ACMDCT_03995 [Halomonadaceae bacterium KBTZ08]